VVELDNRKATLEVGQLVKEILAMAGN
jgi:hypothetical protein